MIEAKVLNVVGDSGEQKRFEVYDMPDAIKYLFDILSKNSRLKLASTNSIMSLLISSKMDNYAGMFYNAGKVNEGYYVSRLELPSTVKDNDEYRFDREYIDSKDALDRAPDGFYEYRKKGDSKNTYLFVKHAGAMYSVDYNKLKDLADTYNDNTSESEENKLNALYNQGKESLMEKQKHAFVIRIIYEDGKMELYQGSNINGKPVLYANESAAYPQVLFLKGKYNDMLRAKNEPLIKDIKLDKVDISTFYESFLEEDMTTSNQQVSMTMLAGKDTRASDIFTRVFKRTPTDKDADIVNEIDKALNSKQESVINDIEDSLRKYIKNPLVLGLIMWYITRQLAK